MKILVTGMAGFIGSYAAKRFAMEGHEVVGLDSVNGYYDPRLKYDRLGNLGFDPGGKFSSPVKSSILPITFIKADISDRKTMESIFAEYKFDKVCHLAAQAGVRYSIENPYAYADSNLTGFLNILEGCRNHNIRHLVYASSSSVYGSNSKIPFSEEDRTDTPVSFYAATKKANEVMAHSYSSLYGLRTTGLRFFTVYGPWGRPDMAPMLFAGRILNGEPIEVFNNGEMWRDFTYIEDIVEGVYRITAEERQQEEGGGALIYNIGNSTPVKLTDFISILEHNLGVRADIRWKPMQKGDVVKTWADVSKLAAATGYSPSTSLEEGIAAFAGWYKEYYRVK